AEPKLPMTPAEMRKRGALRFGGGGLERQGGQDAGGQGGCSEGGGGGGAAAWRRGPGRGWESMATLTARATAEASSPQSLWRETRTRVPVTWPLSARSSICARSVRPLREITAATRI